MATQRITRTTVFLDKPEDWQQWLFYHKDKAATHGVWDIINPANQPPLATHGPEPQKPEPPADLRDPDQRAEYTILSTIWKSKHSKWTARDKVLKEICLNIEATISVRLVPLIQEDPTPYERLTKLMRHIARSDPSRKRDLRGKYASLKTTTRSTEVETWFNEWVHITDMMSALNMPEVQDGQAQEDFLNAAMRLNEVWATHKLIAHIAIVDSKQHTSITTLVSELRQFLRATGHIGATFGSFGASLGIVRGSNTLRSLPQSGPAQTSTTSKPPFTCLCGKEHWYSECFYVNPSIRLSSWTPKPAIQEKFDAARKNPRKAAAMDRALAKGSGQGSPQSPPRVKNNTLAAFDDGVGHIHPENLYVGAVALH
jgi:hypothetical protein